MLPESNSMMWSAYRASPSVSCWAMTIVNSRVARIVSSAWNTSRVPSGSSAAVGSSSTRMRGWQAKAAAIATRCICPPDRLVGTRRRYPSMPTRCSNPSMRSSIRPGSTPRLSIGKASSSSTLAQNSWDSGSCWTYPTSLDSSAMLHSAVLRPATVIVPRMVPSSGFGMIPASAMHSVDLPAPVGPMMPVNDPGRIEKSSSFNALTGSPSSVCGVYHQLRWFAVMIGASFISGRSIVCAVSAVCAVSRRPAGVS